VRDDDRLENLSWKTHLANEHDKFRHNTTTRGAKNASAKLTDDKVRQIRASTATTTEVAAEFDIAYQTAWDIRRRRRWAHVA
jgi:hypothetical protein